MVLDIIYRTNRVRESYNNSNEDKVTFIEPSKIIITSKNVSSIKSLNWFFAKRKNFILTDKKIVIGKQSMYRSDVIRIECYKFRSIIFIKYFVLKIFLNDGKILYIGFKKRDDIIKELNIEETNIHRNNLSVFNPYLIIAFILMVLYFVFK